MGADRRNVGPQWLLLCGALLYTGCFALEVVVIANDPARPLLSWGLLVLFAGLAVTNFRLWHHRRPNVPVREDD